MTDSVRSRRTDVHATEVRIRDAYGDKTSETRDDGVDGTFELHQQWTYTCADAPAASPLIPGS